MTPPAHTFHQSCSVSNPTGQICQWCPLADHGSKWCETTRSSGTPPGHEVGSNQVSLREPGWLPPRCGQYGRAAGRRCTPQSRLQVSPNRNPQISSLLTASSFDRCARSRRCLEQLGPYSVGSVATLGPLLPAASRRKATGSHGFSLPCLFPNPIDLAL